MSFSCEITLDYVDIAIFYKVFRLEAATKWAIDESIFVEGFNMLQSLYFPMGRHLAMSCCRFRGHRERCFMEPEVGDGTTAIYARVQARGGPPDQGSGRILCAGIARPWGAYVAAA